MFWRKIIDIMQLKFLPTLLITRPEALSQTLVENAYQQGWQAVSFCPIEMQLLDEQIGLMQEAVSQADVVFVVSPSAVSMVMPHLVNVQTKAIWACVGASSAELLAKWLPDTQIVFPKDGHDSEAVLRLPMWQKICQQQKKVVILRGTTGRNLLADTLSANGAQVCCLSVYKRIAKKLNLFVLEQLQDNQMPVALVISSQEIAKQLFTQIPIALHTYLKSLLYLSIHPRISNYLQEQGVKHIVDCGANNDAIFAALQLEWKSL